VRLLASDIDGTLVPRLGPVSDRTVAALRAAQDAGVHVVLATGRPPRWMTEIAARTGIRGHAVLANGAVVVELQRVGDPGCGVVRTTTLPVETVLQIAADLRRELPDVSFAVESVDAFGVEPGWPQALEAELPRASLAELLRAADRSSSCSPSCRGPTRSPARGTTPRRSPASRGTPTALTPMPPPRPSATTCSTSPAGWWASEASPRTPARSCRWSRSARPG
jgi:hypothetical protein